MKRHEPGTTLQAPRSPAEQKVEAVPEQRMRQQDQADQAV
jgi:hypothetical protein